MRSLALFLIGLLGFLAAGTFADCAVAQAEAPAPAAAPQDPAHGHDAKTMEMDNGAFFKKQYSHNVPYVLFTPEVTGDPETDKFFWFYNVNKFQWIALAICLLIFLPIKASFRKQGEVSFFTRVFRGWCRWIRDEMVYPVLGEEEGKQFAPYFIFLFFFVAVMNVIGMIPSGGPISTYTATGTPYVTGALALITLVTMLFFGMKKNGVIGFFKGLLPHGLPTALLPLMAVVELVGLLVKPFALTIRLFANMLAGHLVIASLIGLIFLFAKMQGGAATSYLTAVPAAGMAVFIFIIESFVTLLQAYIFTYLSIIFLQQAMHPEH